MIFKIVAIRDRVADAFSVPSFVTNIGQAVRQFGDEVRRPGSEDRPNQLNAHSEDFDLYQLGDYNDDTGEITTHLPRQLAVGKDFK